MSFNAAEQKRALALFLKKDLQDLNAATEAAFRVTAAKIQREVKAELRRNFKRGPASNGSFFNAVSTYNLPPKGQLGPASFVRMGLPFARIFQEGGSITGRKRLAILLPEGANLGFRRISAGNTWDMVWRKHKNQLVVRGSIVFLAKEGKLIPIYKFQKTVKITKRLSFYELAEAAARDLPNEIAQLLG